VDPDVAQVLGFVGDILPYVAVIVVAAVAGSVFSTWLKISPPTIVTPSGWRSSDPVPPPSISGKAPKIAAKVVIFSGDIGIDAGLVKNEFGTSRTRRANSA